MSQAQPQLTPYSYDIIVQPITQVDPAIKEKWARRLSDPATIQEIKQKVSQVDYGQALQRAAMRYAEFMGSDDPRRALAAIKHYASVTAVDPNELVQRLTTALDQKFADAVAEAKDKFGSRLAYILPAANAAKAFAENFSAWLENYLGTAARYFRGAVVAATVFPAFLAAVLADAVADGRLPEAQAEQILSQAADELETILDTIVDGIGGDASIAVDVIPAERKAVITVSVNPKG